MSQSINVKDKPCILQHYKQLCATHGAAPSAPEIEEIRLAAGTPKGKQAASLFEHALLYFLPRSAVVFEQDTLLLGWSVQSDGSKQEIWYKLNDNKVNSSSRLYRQCGGPRGSDHQVKTSDPLCDEWHPSLAAICAPVIRDNRYLRYTYFSATVRLMRANPPPASIEDFSKVNPNRAIASRRTLVSKTPNQNITGTPTSRPRLKREHDALDAVNERSVGRNQHEEISGSKQATGGSTQRTRYRRRGIIESEILTQSRRDEELGRGRKRHSVVELSDSDSERDTRAESEAIAAPLSNQEDDMPAEQEIKNMLRNKKVSEIKDMLAKRSGQLPDWIEEIVKEEMKRKMSRDLAKVKNFF